MSVYDFLVDFAIASALILVGQFLRAKIKFFQEFFIPASMLAGFIGLLLGERFLNVVHFSSGASSYAGALIIVVFTVVGLNGFSKGQKGGADSTVKRVLSFTMYRNVIMFIQFALGIAVTLTVVTWLVPDINPGFGVLMASGFTGGHGTAAAVGSTFNDVYGWAEATDLGMTFATVGILSGVFGGLIWIKIATKKGWTAYVKDFKYISGDMRTGLIPKENRQPMGHETISSVSLDSLAFHLCLVLMVAGGGYLFNQKVLVGVLGISGAPDFTIAFLIGLVVFFVFRKLGVYEYVDKEVNNRISGTATDYLVFFGVATINTEVIVEYAVPLAILIVVGWVCVILTMIPFGCCMNNKSWFERSIFCYGYSTGVFAIGFVLLRIVDPENRSHTAEDVAMSPWLSLAEVFLWSAIPAALVSGNGWLVVVASLVVMAVSIAFCVVGQMWDTARMNARGGYDKIQD